MTKFLASKLGGIRRVKVERETSSQVLVAGGWATKVSAEHRYCDTWRKAQLACIKWHLADMARATRLLSRAQTRLVRAQELRPPPPRKKKVPALDIGSQTVINRILGAVSTAWGVSIERLKSRDRTEHAFTPRMVAAYIMGAHTNLTWHQIGASICRSHETARYDYQTISDRLVAEPKLLAKVRDIQTSIGLGNPA